MCKCNEYARKYVKKNMILAFYKQPFVKCEQLDRYMFSKFDHLLVMKIMSQPFRHSSKLKTMSLLTDLDSNYMKEKHSRHNSGPYWI